MKLLFKTLILLLCFPALVMASNEDGKFKGKYTKEKTVNKEFTVNPNAGLEVSNMYGNIDIVTWNENRTVFEVHIKANGNDEAKVQEKLNEIRIEFTKNSSLVTAKTMFSEKTKWNSWWGKDNKKVSVEVNYIIKLPVGNSVDLNNDYGAISLNELDGNANISCDYGQLNIGELRGENNYLNFDYTSNSTIEYMKNGKINADYSGFTLEKVGDLELNADYTQSEVVEALDVKYNCDYGKVTIGQAEDVIGSGDYVTNRLGTISGSVNLNTDYGSIRINRMTATAKNVKINSNYTGIKLGFDSGYSFNFALDLSYSGFHGDESVTVSSKSVQNSKKQYSGYHGIKNSGNKVSINSDYGSITFIKL
jgi:hypothetical protein